MILRFSANPRAIPDLGATGQESASPLYADFDRLERMYFAVQGKYCDLCANFEKWLYNQGYSGLKVASDTHIMVVLKEDYPEDMEGKLMRKDGTIEDMYVKYPNWRMCFPDPKKMEMVAVRLDFAGIRAFEADFKAKKKLDKRMKGYVKVGGSLFRLEYLIKAVRFMEHIGTDELMLSADGKRAALAVSGDSKMVLMPACPREKFEDYEVCYGA